MNDQGDEELRDILRHLATRLTSLEDKLANVADHIDSSSRVLGNRIEALERRSTTRPTGVSGNPEEEPNPLLDYSGKCLSCGADPLLRTLASPPPSTQLSTRFRVEASSSPQRQPTPSSLSSSNPVSVGRRSGVYGVEKMRNKR
jgi:hypothetical protein